MQLEYTTPVTTANHIDTNEVGKSMPRALRFTWLSTCLPSHFQIDSTFGENESIE